MHDSGFGGNNEVGRYIACFCRMRSLFTMLKMPLVHEETHLKFYKWCAIIVICLCNLEGRGGWRGGRGGASNRNAFSGYKM